MACKKISFQAWQQSKGEQDLLIDVRTPAEFERAHLPGSINLPLANCNPAGLGNILQQLGAAGGVKVCLICQSGTRSNMAAQQLEQWSEGELMVMDCGISAFDKSQLNSTGKGVISVDRQVRIVAGALVLTGVAGSLLLAPGWVYLSAFVGAGLMFAGITDTCAMAGVLAKMPWNNRQ